jgi:hypothetical protein
MVYCLFEAINVVIYQKTGDLQGTPSGCGGEEAFGGCKISGIVLLHTTLPLSSHSIRWALEKLQDYAGKRVVPKKYITEIIT